ncbi:MAG: amino acid-binding protein [Oscillospiraceae bacterium]|nr:amino acid-binding protein [Oscillospiraceae bacterium]
MASKPKYFIVEAEALPKIFLKVAEVKRLLDVHEVGTVNEATSKVGISRSAFYKYKDAVRPFQDMHSGQIVTFNLTLRDEPGSLSKVLETFAKNGANIQTINQSIPGNGFAVVNLGAEISGLRLTFEEFILTIASLTGVLRYEIVAG